MAMKKANPAPTPMPILAVLLSPDDFLPVSGGMRTTGGNDVAEGIEDREVLTAVGSPALKRT